MDIQDLNTFRSIEELATYQGEVKQRLSGLNAEFAGQPLPEEYRSEFGTLTDQHREISKRIRELEARNSVVEALGTNEANREAERTDWDSPAHRGSLKEREIYDLSTLRVDVMRPEQTRQQFRDRAMRAVELARFAHPGVRDQDSMRGHVAKLIDNDSMDNEVARRILTTGSPAYQRGFMKYLAGRENAMTQEERTAMAVGTGSAGGYAVVYQLDPTFIPTYNGAVNPFRSIARVVTISGTNEWRGVTSGQVTASYAAEAAAATDNSPTLAQPDIVVQRAQAFVPVSIELTQDLPSLQSELAMLIQDSKDILEATQFATGTGTAPYPQGVLTGATNTTTAGGTASFAVADVYALEGALGARFRPRAVWLANRAIYNKVRQFDTSGGAAMWLGYPNPLQNGVANTSQGSIELRLIGYPAYEATAMASTLTTGNLIAVLGDFNHYVIVDRVGMDIEVIPHLFDQSTAFPTGQRGIYAYWRNSARVMTANAFQVLKTG